VLALLVVEHLDVIEQLGLRFRIENQLFIAAVPCALPRWLMLQVMPCAASTRW